MTRENYEKLSQQFRRLFESRWDATDLSDYDELRRKFVFHMTEVEYNLRRLSEVYEKPDDCDLACLQDRVELFFLDCVPHLMAAANIYDDIPQIFEEQKGVHDWASFKDDEPTAH
jgi:hypothetical protein